MEDISKTEKQEVTATGQQAENVTDSGTAAGTYRHVFSKPYEYEDKTYKELVFDFEKLIGEDLVAIENEMAAVGEYVISPEISTSFLYRMAAKAANIGSDAIAHMPLRDFGKIKNQARDFLISTGF